MNRRQILLFIGAYSLTGCEVTKGPKRGSEFTAILEAATTTLRTDLEKGQLLEDIRRVYHWRTNLAPLDHESDPVFQRDFEESYQIVEDWLRSRIKIRLQFDDAVAEEMAKAYEKNRHIFKEFGRSIIGQDRDFVGRSVFDISVIQARYSAVAFAVDANFWRSIASYTGFFPFC